MYVFHFYRMPIKRGGQLIQILHPALSKQYLYGHHVPSSGYLCCSTSIT